jgi:sugar/nucleoside kinase (ribokinase family)
VPVAPGGERTMVADRGANLALSDSDLPPDRFAAGTHLHLSGYTLLHPGPRPAALAALALASAAGMTISVDPASARPLAAAGPARFLADTGGATWCLPNLDEARLLTGLDDPRAAARALTAHYREVVVTLGPAGACWTDGERSLTVAVEPVQVVDATGAGDAFAAGFLHARLTGADPEAALAAGARLAARAVGRVGARC